MSFRPRKPKHPRIDPSEFDDPFFAGSSSTKEPKKPNVYMELANEQQQLSQSQEQKSIVFTELSPDDIAAILMSTSLKLEENPDTELTQVEASLIYQVDIDLPEQGLWPDSENKSIHIPNLARFLKAVRGFANDSMADEEIRQLRDYEQVKSLIIERLISEKDVIQTVEALGNICDGLGIERFSPADYMNALREKIVDWEECGAFDYLAIELIKNNSRHNIVPVPNVEFTHEQIFALAKKFAALQSDKHRTFIFDETFPEYPLYSQYTSSELSGQLAAPDQSIRLSLLPSRPNPELYEQTIAQQRSSFEQMQLKNPRMEIRVPTILEGVSLWYVLHKLGSRIKPNNSDTYDSTIPNKTYIRAFNLDQKQVNDLLLVPACSLSGERSESQLTGSIKSDYGDARISVG